MYLDPPNPEHLELTGISHQTSHSCSEGPKFVYGDLRCSETVGEEEGCQMLGVVVRKNLTTRRRVQRLLARVSKSGVGDQQEESDFLLDVHSFPLDSESVFGVLGACQLCCARGLEKLIGQLKLLWVQDCQLCARETIRVRKTLALAEALKRTPPSLESTW
jgi:hypothetical protein